MKRKFVAIIIAFLALVVSPLPLERSLAAVSVPSLSGRILLQVESHGEAWYINPLDFKRYYLGRPDDAFNILRRFGLGISEKDFAEVQAALPNRLAGRILIRVEKNGEAYYADPVSRKLAYLGRPIDTFNILRSRGLGISEHDISQIPIGSLVVSPSNISSPQARNFTFEYRGRDFQVSLEMEESAYKYYSQLTKLVYYYGEESDAVRDSFYALFLKTKEGDRTISQLASSLRQAAQDAGLGDNELPELALAFVQSIPYDHDKAAESSFTANMPYETLYLNKGVCSEKVFLGVLLLRELGYGAAVLDFPEKNHSALGIQCDSGVSTSGSGYCYGETTNRLPFGAVPPSLSGGQADAGSSWTAITSASQLGKMEIYQKTEGRKYDPSATRTLAATIASQEGEIAALKAQIEKDEDYLAVQEEILGQKKEEADYYYNQGNLDSYRVAAKEYNALVEKFNGELAGYRAEISSYNNLVASYNAGIKEFYWHL